MVFMIVVPIIAGGLTVYLLKKEGYIFSPLPGLDDTLISVVVTSLIVFVFVFIGLIVALIIGFFCPAEYIQSDTYRIVSLSDKAGVSGDFFLGCGVIDSKLYYFFYREDGQGYRLGKIEASKTTIVEKDRDIGVIYLYEDIPIGIYKYLALCSGQKYVIEVPKGSIIRSFKLNLE